MDHRASTIVRKVFASKGFGLYAGPNNDSPLRFNIGSTYQVRPFKTRLPVAIPDIAYKANDGLHVIGAVQFGTDGVIGLFTVDRGMKTVNRPTQRTLDGLLVIVDDLTLIRGISTGIEITLHRHEIYRYEQIAAWKPQDVLAIGPKIGSVGLINQLEWIDQAKILASGNTTSFSRRMRDEKRRA